MSDDTKRRMDFSKHPRLELPKDDTLFFEYEDSRQMYVLLAGSLGVFREEVQVATIDEPLSIVGEISALTAKPRNATVRALQHAKLVVIDDPEELCAEYPQMGAKLARLLASRLDAMNEQFVELKLAVARAREAGHPPAPRVVTGDAPTVVPGITAGSAPAAATPATWPAVDERRPAEPASSGDSAVDAMYRQQVFESLDFLLEWDPAGT